MNGVKVPEGARLILASENLLEKWGTRDEHGARITVEWGEPTAGGWYEPVFTVHFDDNPMAAALARCEGLEGALRSTVALVESVNECHGCFDQSGSVAERESLEVARALLEGGAS